MLIHGLKSVAAKAATAATVPTPLMMFEKGNPYLKECLQEYAHNYVIKSWEWNGPDLLTRIWKNMPSTCSPGNVC